MLLPRQCSCSCGFASQSSVGRKCSTSRNRYRVVVAGFSALYGSITLSVIQLCGKIPPYPHLPSFACLIEDRTYRSLKKTENVVVGDPI